MTTEDPTPAAELLELHDELDRVAHRPFGWRVALFCVVAGGAVALLLLVSGAPVARVVELVLVTAVPGAYLMEHARTRRDREEELRRRIDHLHRR